MGKGQELAGYANCTSCGSWRPVSDFAVERKRGGVRLRHCYPCNRKYRAGWRERNRQHIREYDRQYLEDPKHREESRRAGRERGRRLRKNKPEVKRTQQQRYYAKLKRDPKRYEEYLQNQRIGRVLREYERRGVWPVNHLPDAIGAYKPINHTATAKREQVDATSFLEWYDDYVIRQEKLRGNKRPFGGRYVVSIETLCKMVGVSERRIRAARETGKISYPVAEAFLTIAGHPEPWRVLDGEDVDALENTDGDGAGNTNHKESAHANR